MKKLQVQKTPEIERPLHLIDNNAVGKEINKANRVKALKVLEEAKEIESQKLSDGAKWMHKDKTVVLVPPHKVENYKLNGFR